MRNRTMLFVAGAAALALSTAQAEIDAKATKAFKSKCSSCHGVTGKGDTEMGQKLKTPNFTDAAFQKGVTDEALKTAIKDGKKGDKVIEDHAFGEKLADQIDNLVKIVRSFGGK